MAQASSGNAQGPILGLQIESCEHIIERLRNSLSFDSLNNVANQLYTTGKLSTGVSDEALNNLFNISKPCKHLKAYQ
jgi:hypothetical protein